MVSRYQKRISGRLLDRIDIHIEVPRVEYEKLSDERLGEPSSLFLKNRHHSRAGGGGTREAAAAL
jgi:magnesium chelatase family protein